MEGKCWKEGWRQNSSDKWRDDRNQWRNRGWTRGEHITIREIDLSVMNEGNGLVEWFVPVTSGLIVGCFVRGWKAMGYCDADWQHRSTRRRQFAFSLHSRLTSSPVWFDTHTYTHIQTCKHMALSQCRVQPPVSIQYEWQLHSGPVCVCVGFGKGSLSK